MFRKLIFTSFLITLIVSACDGAPGSSSTKLKVVATFSVLGDLVQNVGGDLVEVQTLVGPGLDTHTFEPSPADSQMLIEAALIYENGLGFETWLDELYAASGSKAKRVAVSNGIEPLKAEAHESETGRKPAAFDPHVWHSVANAIIMIKNIRDALVQTDPANAVAYQANAEAYMMRLQELDTWVFNEVNRLPAERRILVTTHDTFGYFAERYGFEVLGTLLPTSTEGASPSAQALAELVTKLRQADVPAVFAENVSANSLLRQVADEAGVTVVASLYTDALGPPESDGGTYLGMMRYNVTTIVAELRK